MSEKGKGLSATGLIAIGAIVTSVVIIAISLGIYAAKGQSKPQGSSTQEKKEQSKDSEENPLVNLRAVTVEYEESGRFPQMKPLLRNSGLLEYLSSEFESALKLKKTSVIAKECGSLQPVVYNPANNQIFVCYERLDAEIRRNQSSGMDANQAGYTSLYSTAFNVLSAFGRSTINQFNLPYTGDSQIAADEFATVFALNKLESGSKVVKGGILFAANDSTSELNSRIRARFLSCWLVGSDTELYKQTAASFQMSSSKVAECQGSYSGAVQSWNRLLEPYKNQK